MISNPFASLSNAGVIKLEITADDLLKAVKEVAKETANVLLAEMNKERIPEFISRKEAMQLLKVKTVLTMIKWEEKGDLDSYRISGRIFYRKDEVINSLEKFKREEVRYA